MMLAKFKFLLEKCKNTTMLDEFKFFLEKQLITGDADKVLGPFFWILTEHGYFL